MNEISKEQFMISRLTERIASLEAALAEKEFFIQYLQQQVAGKEAEKDGKEEK